MGPGHKVSLYKGVPPRGPKIPNFYREYLKNGKSQRYMSNKAQHLLDKSFPKMYNMGQ